MMVYQPANLQSLAVESDPYFNNWRSLGIVESLGLNRLVRAKGRSLFFMAGYTDNVASDQINQGLSEYRAGAVRDYLVQQVVPEHSITATWFGGTLPVASNDN